MRARALAHAGRAFAFIAPVMILVVVIALVVIPVGADGRRAITAGAQRSGLLEMVSQSPSVELGADFEARVRITSAPTSATLLVKVHDRTTTRESFRDALGGKSPTPVLRTTTLPAMPDAAGSVPISIGTRIDASGTADRLLIGPGVYPVEVALADANQTLATLTTTLVVLRPATQGPPLGVGIVVPLGGGAIAHQPDGSVVLPPAATRGVLEMTTVLNEHASTPVTLVAVPERLSAVDDAAARRSLRIVAAGRQVAPAPYVPVDAPAWLASGLANDLGSEVDLGADALGASLAAPSATWVATGPVDAATATWLAARGTQALVVPDNSLSGLDAERFPGPPNQPFLLDGVTGVRGVGSDTALAAHVSETGDAVLDANHLLADLALLDLDRPAATRMVVVVLPAATSPELLDVLLAGVQSTRTLEPGTIDQLLERTPLAGSSGETDGTGTPLSRGVVAPSAPSLDALPTRLRETRDDVATYRSVLDADDPRWRDLDVRALAAVDQGLDRRAQLERLDAVRAQIADELAKIVAPSRQTITLTARDGAVSISVANTAGYPVHVVLELEGPRLELPGHDDGRIELALQGDADTTRVQVDVRARGSGDAALDVTVVTPDGRITLGRTRFTVRSTAFSGVGIVLSIGALGFLLFWWAKHTLDARRSTERTPRHAVIHDGDAG
ncbi:MAG: DUF6049 family protein [Acidimicrobiales bacterium]